MNLSLNDTTEKLIADRLSSGKYATAEEVVTAALGALENQEHFGDFASGELEALVAEGENSGPPIDGDKFLTEWRALRTPIKAAHS